MKLKKIIFLFILFIIFFLKNTNAFENKILIKINNEIITTLDVLNEINYLKAFNKEINKIEKNEIIEVAKNSLIKNKVKEIEIKKNISKINIDQSNLDELIKFIYSKIGMTNLDEFKNYLSSYNLTTDYIRKKIEIDAFWNEMIIKKYLSKISIDENAIKIELEKNKVINLNSYFLYEIVFNLENSENLNNIFKNIEKTILKSGFKNAALVHSISDSAIKGGELGWIDQDMISNSIDKELKNLQIGEYTKPIQTPGGFLILLVSDKKKIKKENNNEKSLEELINQKKNIILNQFSNIHYNKAKKNVFINEL